MNRYQLYNKLMEVCFWVSAFILVWLVIGRAVPALLPYMRPLGRVIRILMNIDVLAAMFLVTARFMRDEYAELIWQRTAYRFVNFIVLGPLGLIIAIIVFRKEVRTAIPAMLPDAILAALAKEPEPSMVFFTGIAATFVLVVQFVPLLFIIFYKWALWRDSR